MYEIERKRTERKCDEPGCDEKHFGLGKCKKHHQAICRRRCREEGCYRLAKAKGWCNVHYLRHRTKDYVRYQPKPSLKERDEFNLLCRARLAAWKRPAGMDEVLEELR